MIYYENHSRDPAFNMAVEEALLASAGEEPLFLLWQNSPAVILGRHQDARREVDLAYAQQEGIAVIRRLSGGGAVYHDAGNLNYTFILPRCGGESKTVSSDEFRLWSKPVLDVLRGMGVNAEFSGRNDLTVGGRKISGTAQALLYGHLLHHGTLLLSTDFGKMSRVLRVDAEKLRGKGVASVRSRVANLSESIPVDAERMKQAILGKIAEENPLTCRTFSPVLIGEIERLKREKYTLPAWNLGEPLETPSCTAITRRKRFAWGEVQVTLQLDGEVVAGAVMTGDFFADRSPSLLTEKWVGSPYSRAALEERIEQSDLEKVFSGLKKAELLDLLFQP